MSPESIYLRNFFPTIIAWLSAGLGDGSSNEVRLVNSRSLVRPKQIMRFDKGPNHDVGYQGPLHTEVFFYKYNPIDRYKNWPVKNQNGNIQAVR